MKKEQGNSKSTQIKTKLVFNVNNGEKDKKIVIDN